MEKINLIIGITVGAVTLVSAFIGLAAWFVKVQIGGVQSQVQSLTAEVHSLRQDLQRVDERQRNHTADSDKHISAAWREALDKRMERIEDGMLKLLERK